MSMEVQEPELLNVKQTAERLGVHPNTVRAWAKDGVLKSARVPGSRFHRFDARDVERLKREKGAQVSSVEKERRAVGPELVDATQLHAWAATKDAQAHFPELIRRLLASTPGVSNISVRSAEGTAAPGWDGRADSSTASYLPRGSLRIELGVDKNPKGKADKEFEKRRDKAADADRGNSIFVFITPRRWANAAKWADDRRTEGVFKDVRVLDADDLEGWLHATPAAHHWISEHLGRRPQDALTLEQWWSRFQNRTQPSLPAQLFLAGRDAERQKLLAFIDQPPDAVSVRAAWLSDAIAFVISVLMTNPDRDTMSRLPLVVQSADVWERVVVQSGRMIMLPLFDDPDVAKALENGHHVVVPVDRDDDVVVGQAIELPPPDRLGAQSALENALENASNASDAAYELSALARRSMPSLVRKLAREPRFKRPPWTRAPDADVFAPLMLLGRWTPTEDDRNLVEQIVGKPWDEIERTLLRWRHTDDPPLVLSGAEWHLASPDEAYLLLCGSLTSTDLTRWRGLVAEVLLEVDPRLELPPDEQPMAQVLGKTRRYSDAIRRGLAQGVALLGSIKDVELADGATGEDYASGVVREVFGRANGDESGRTWHAFSDVMPLLAEAAPNQFLDAVHDDLDREQPLLASMFQDNHDGAGFYSSSPHTGLLWALETLSWSSDYLLSATLALARLEAVDPGGQLANRPLASLTHILVAWVPHTSAPLDLKIRALEAICKQHPEVGWALVLALWPSQHATSSPPSSSRFHDWRPERRTVLLTEWKEFVDALVQVTSELAGSDPTRWAELVTHLGPLPEDNREGLLARLEQVIGDVAAMESEARLLLWERLHTEVARHRQFADAPWAMTEEPLARMQAIADRLEDPERVERFAYLFDWRPDLPEVDRTDRSTYDAELRKLRIEAVRQTLNARGMEGLAALAERSRVPRHLGLSVGEALGGDYQTDLIGWLDSDRPYLLAVAAGWVVEKTHSHGAEWLSKALSDPNADNPTRRVHLMLNAPARADIWDVVEAGGAELHDAYWNDARPFAVEPADTPRAVDELLGHKRPWAAIDLLAGYTLDADSAAGALDTKSVRRVLDAALKGNPSDATSQSLGYEIGILLDYLEEHGIDASVIATYEFYFFALLQNHRLPRALYRALATDPTLFVSLVKRVFRGKDEPRRETTKEEQGLAHHAYWILSHWKSEFPGLHDDRLDGEELRTWVRDARNELAEAGRADIGDEMVGQVLARSPEGDDGIWPAEPVRELIEEIGSTHLETGIHLGVVNLRGVTSRGVFAGGGQERALAEKYHAWEHETAGQWRRTNRVLRQLAENYERDARREDAEAKRRSDVE
jgi:excisionase family DNA binding protein